jgi:AraC-like DNA-binding protein
VARVCLEVGFASVGSFTTTFRRHVGVTPTAYRLANRGVRPADRIPLCFAMAWARRPANGAFREDGPPDAD